MPTKTTDKARLKYLKWTTVYMTPLVLWNPFQVSYPTVHLLGLEDALLLLLISFQSKRSSDHSKEVQAIREASRACTSSTGLFCNIRLMSSVNQNLFLTGSSKGQNETKGLPQKRFDSRLLQPLTTGKLRS